MKKTFFCIAFMLFGVFAFANNSVKYKSEKEIKKITEKQDCKEYAHNAATQEVLLEENLLAQAMAWEASFNFWLGYCEGAGGTAMDPVFLD